MSKLNWFDLSAIPLRSYLELAEWGFCIVWSSKSSRVLCKSQRLLHVSLKAWTVLSVLPLTSTIFSTALGFISFPWLTMTCFLVLCRRLAHKWKDYWMLVANLKKCLWGEPVPHRPWLVGVVYNPALADIQKNLKKNCPYKFGKSENVVRAISVMKKLAIAKEDKMPSWEEWEE